MSFGPHALVRSVAGAIRRATLTAFGLVYGDANGGVASTAALTNGQLIVGQTSAAPLPKTLSGDGTLAADGTLTLTGVVRFGDIAYVKMLPGVISAGVTTVACQLQDSGGNNVATTALVRIRTLAETTAKLEAAASPVGTRVLAVTDGSTAALVQESVWQTTAGGAFAVKITDLNSNDHVWIEATTDHGSVGGKLISGF